MDAVIEVEGLRKEFSRVRRGKTVAIQDLHMVVPRGGVFGFLGPNGSGKTTTIRCVLGLVNATKGRTRLLGAEPHHLRSVITRVGSIVESPAYFPTFTGKANLELLGRIDGIGKARVAEVLERVGLGGRGDDLFKTYSLGMKQRLGIAAALLKDPELLILDEPANGLDPAGIKEMRELIRSLGAEGRTVFVSSHLLGEVQQMCDSVAIISRGRMVTTGRVDDVLAMDHTATLVLQLEQRTEGVEVLRAAGYDVTVDSETGALNVGAPPSDAAKVNEILAKKKLYLSELRADVGDLETVFLKLTADEEPQI